MSITVKGRAFSDAVVNEIIRRFLHTADTRTKQTMIDLIRALDVPEEVIEPAAKRFLKRITDDELARFDPQTSTYIVENDGPQPPVVAEQHCKEGLVSSQKSNNQSTSAANESYTKTEQFQTHDHITGLSHAARAFCLIISAAAILAVVSTWGLFAASIAGTAQLAAILITAMVSIDLMRPFLVAMALISFRNRLWLRFTGALTLALVLAPLSVFTSFSMLSAEFSKGADSRQNALQSAGSKEAARATLDTEIARLRDVSATQWAEWQSECANGGCGANAGRLQGAAERTDTRIATLVSERKALSGTPQVSPDRTSRITTSLTLFGIPEAIVVQIAPLLLALGLELAAVLGPAILLVPVTPKRPVRAPRFANPDSTEGGPQ